ncbi:MAG: glycosyltransferase family 2 protein [Anaerolineales bacterium]|nr:glycosyltransferase family 2 protein [Anaerolineales bacterium]
MPTVSIIVPCYNEQATITWLLDAIAAQTYPRQDLELVIADGMSTDATRQRIADYQQQHPDLDLRIVDNPQRAIPSALNRAIEAARGTYIVRLDAHSMPDKHYIERCIQALQAGKGDNVGGVWEILPGGEGWAAQGIAIAAAHPLGVGDARYRVGGEAQMVDTVPFGSFRRELALQLGKFDESLLTNEDYEFNTRLRKTGGKIWLDPAIRSRYFARSTITALAGQYWRYGYWKAQMLRRYPETIRWRQFMPPAFVLSLTVLGALAFWIPMAAWLLATEILIYTLALTIAGAQAAAKHRQPMLLLSTPLAIACMHLAWGTALVWGLLRPPARINS